jgi:hypothetical protein
MSTSTELPPIAFSSDDLNRAYDEWRCNCGPAALAAIAGVSLEEVRLHIGEFSRRGYMNVAGMRAAVVSLGYSISDMGSHLDSPSSTFPRHGLVRVQFTGPWTAKGASPRWAATHTHWVGSHRIGEVWWVFDVNGGWLKFNDWQEEIVPRLTEVIKRADGGWYPSHRWEIRRP